MTLKIRGKYFGIVEREFTLNGVCYDVLWIQSLDSNHSSSSEVMQGNSRSIDVIHGYSKSFEVMRVRTRALVAVQGLRIDTIKV